VQEQQQRAAPDEVDDHQRGQRSERVDEAGLREKRPPPHGFPDAPPLEQCGGHREPGECQPGNGRQDEEPDQHRDREEDDDPDHERGEDVPAARALARRQEAGPDVGEREERRGDDEHARLGRRLLAERDLVEGRNDEPERERAPEAGPVEPDRLSHELTDGALRGRGILGIAKCRVDGASSLVAPRR
jgi:hypothetical protein